MHRKRGSESALGFGYGQHRCIAEHLARAELECVFGKSPPSRLKTTTLLWLLSGGVRNACTATLFEKLPNLKLAIPIEQVAYTKPTKDVGIPELPVVF